MEEIKRVNSNPEFREYMSAEEDNRKIENTRNTRLHEAEERGYAEGIEEGLSQGLSQGLEQGLSKGRIESARNMINYGLDSDTIVKYTGLEKEVVESLRKNL